MTAPTTTPEAFYILRIESRIGVSAAGLEHTGKVAEELRAWAREWLKSWNMRSRKYTEGVMLMV